MVAVEYGEESHKVRGIVDRCPIEQYVVMPGISWMVFIRSTFPSIRGSAEIFSILSFRSPDITPDMVFSSTVAVMYEVSISSSITAVVSAFMTAVLSLSATVRYPDDMYFSPARRSALASEDVSYKAVQHAISAAAAIT